MVMIKIAAQMTNGINYRLSKRCERQAAQAVDPVEAAYYLTLSKGYLELYNKEGKPVNGI